MYSKNRPSDSGDVLLRGSFYESSRRCIPDGVFVRYVCWFLYYSTRSGEGALFKKLCKIRSNLSADLPDVEQLLRNRPARKGAKFSSVFRNLTLNQMLLGHREAISELYFRAFGSCTTKSKYG